MLAEALHIELLHSCRLHCLACDHRLAGKASLSAAGLRPVFADPRFRDLRLVSFSGGEPLLHPGLTGIINEAAAAFPRARLVLLTSLSESGRLMRLLRKLPPPLLARLHIGASLDGPAAVHDRMRGSPGSFAGLEKTLRLARGRFQGLSLGFTFTATALNAGHFYETWREAARMGVPLGPQFLVPNKNTRGLELAGRDKATLRAGLARAAAELPGGIHPLRRELESALAFLSGVPYPGECGAGRGLFFLSPEGSFYLCPFHKELTASLSSLPNLRAGLRGRAAAACAGCFLRCRI